MAVTKLSDREVTLVRIRETAYLAPAFLRAVDAVMADMRAEGFNPYIFETLRTDRLQAHYHGTGASKAFYGRDSMHYYGLAVDIVDAALLWSAPAAFWNALGRLAKKHGLTWGGDWDGDGDRTDQKFHDRPHVQWNVHTPSPTPAMKNALKSGGLYAVWALVKAL